MYVAAVVGLCLTIGLMRIATAEEAVAWTDFRGRTDYSTEELARALFPTPQVVRTRSLGPAHFRPSLPARIAVALNVYFAPNSENIPSIHYLELDKLGTVLSWPQYTDYRIQIEGHTDSLGVAQQNKLLSEKRVESIKQYLVQRFRVAPERLRTVGYGPSKPIAPNTTPDGRRQNRRVEVVNLGGVF
jgi:OOP family OmpA-OmpF porin